MMCCRIKSCPVKIQLAGGRSSKGLGEVLKDELILVFMSRSPTIVVLESEDVVLAFPGVDTQVENFCVRITLTEIADSRGLPFPGSFQGSETFDTLLKVGAKSSFIRREGAELLSHVQLKNDIKSHNKLKLAVGEEALAPRS
jgi:hypothetical protein